MHLGLAALPLLAGAWTTRAGAPTTADPVTAFRADLAAGRAELEWEPRQGYLRSLLRGLRIDPASQVLVFSRTSLQSDQITRANPRAIYFDGTTYVGYIPGAPLIEIASVHPTKGIVFTTIPNTRPGPKRASFATERDRCAHCHGGSAPNLFARSVHAAPSGYPRAFAPSFEMTPRLPLAKRWGGWYVTGQHGAMRHMGNVVSEGTDERPRLDTERGANVTDLRPWVRIERYLTPHSDIAALMAMEAQMDVQNAIVRAGLLSRPGVDGAPVTPEDLVEGGEPLVAALLGVGEAPLTAPVSGTSSFAEAYIRTAPEDDRGRSLAQLDLRTRLLRYPCHPLIYSPSFDALPAPERAYVLRRLAAILTGADPGPHFAHLSPEDRAAVREILAATKPEFARALANR